MGNDHVDHDDIAGFARENVNLPDEVAESQVARIRPPTEKLDDHLARHTDFPLRRMLLAGSLAKGTASRPLKCDDMVCYVDAIDMLGVGASPRDSSPLGTARCCNT